METGIVKRPSSLPQPQGGFESAIPETWTRDKDSTSALVAMVATNVILLLMLAA